MQIKFIFLMGLLLAATGQAQTMYKWVDEDGNVQFTDTPPPEQDAEALEYKSDRNSEASDAADQSADGAISKSNVIGQWRSTADDQTIDLTLSASGQSRWKVTFQGKDWSDLTGTWVLDGDRIVLNNQLGRSVYAVSVVSGSEIELTDPDWGTAMLFRK